MRWDEELKNRPAFFHVKKIAKIAPQPPVNPLHTLHFAHYISLNFGFFFNSLKLSELLKWDKVVWFPVHISCWLMWTRYQRHFVKMG